MRRWHFDYEWLPQEHIRLLVIVDSGGVIFDLWKLTLSITREAR
jgi:hypothetical protein